MTVRSFGRVVSAHQVFDLKPAVFRNGLERSDHMSDGATRKRQQHPLINDDTAADVLDVRDGVHGKRAGDAFVINRHHDIYQPGRNVLVEVAASPVLTIGGRHPVPLL